MPLYFSSHTTACLTKQATRELMRQLMQAKEVRFRRAVSSQLGGRMVCEAEAADQATIEKFYESRLMTCEWIMRIDLDAKDGQVEEY